MKFVDRHTVARVALVSALMLVGAAGVAMAADELVDHGTIQDVLNAAASTGTVPPTGGEHESGGLPQFNAHWFPSQLFWLAITFGILFTYFSRIALPRIADTLTARATAVQGNIQSAEQLAAKAQTIRESYERDMAKARDKAADVMRAVDARIKEKTADQLYSYRTKVTMEIARAEDAVANERTRLVGDMNRLAAEIAANAAGQILDTSVDVDQAAQVVQKINPTRKAA